jgi:hypothetical protein
MQSVYLESGGGRALTGFFVDEAKKQMRRGKQSKQDVRERRLRGYYHYSLQRTAVPYFTPQMTRTSLPHAQELHPLLLPGWRLL